MTSVFWKVTAPGTILVALSGGPRVETVPEPEEGTILLCSSDRGVFQ